VCVWVCVGGGQWVVVVWCGGSGVVWCAVQRSAPAVCDKRGGVSASVVLVAGSSSSTLHQTPALPVRVQSPKKTTGW
jgi:hypothetical protein